MGRQGAFGVFNQKKTDQKQMIYFYVFCFNEETAVQLALVFHELFPEKASSKLTTSGVVLYSGVDIRYQFSLNC